MSICSVCFRYYWQSRCPDCDARYEQQIGAKQYPRAFHEAGLTPTRLEWEHYTTAGQRKAAQMEAALERQDDERKARGATPGENEPTQEEKDAMIRKEVEEEEERIAQVCIANRRLKHTNVTAQRQREQDRKLDKYDPYKSPR